MIDQVDNSVPLDETPAVVAPAAGAGVVVEQNTPASSAVVTLSRFALRRLVQRELCAFLLWQRRSGLLRYGGFRPSLGRVGVRWETMRRWSRDAEYVPVVPDTPLVSLKVHRPAFPPDVLRGEFPDVIDSRPWYQRWKE